MKVAAPEVTISSGGMSCESAPARAVTEPTALTPSSEQSEPACLGPRPAESSQTAPAAAALQHSQQPGSTQRRLRALIALSPRSSLVFFFQKPQARKQHVAAKGRAAGRPAGCPWCLPQDLCLTALSPLFRHLDLSLQEASDDSSIGTSDEVNVISQMSST